MRKLKSVIYGVLGIGVGFVIGATWVARTHVFLEWHQSSSNTSTGANLAVATLRDIRTGDTDKATERLELQLDRAILSLADIYRERPRPQDGNSVIRTLSRAREYRVDYPRKTDNPTIDQAVAKALVLPENLPTGADATERGYGESPSKRAP